MLNLPLHFMNENNEIDTFSFFSSVLFVEPDEEFRNQTLESLKSLVGECVTARSGEEALNQLENHFVELVILAVNLPDISGASLLHTIEHYRPGLPTIVVTANDNLDAALNAMREGAWDYAVRTEPAVFKERIRHSIQRVAERKLEHMKEFELRSEHNAFWAAAQTAQDGLAIVGSTGAVTFVNSAFMDFLFVLGAVHSPNHPANIVNIVADQDRNLAVELQSALSGQRSGNLLWSSEFKLEPKLASLEGKHRHFELHLSSISVGGLDGSGFGAFIDSRRHVLWIKDITRRKEQEKFQRDVISTTSHDLKGPLGTIACAAELIADSDEPLSESTVKLVQRIYSCAKKALSHIEEFLSARKIEDGVLTVDPTWNKVDELLEDVVLDYSMMAAGKNISLAYVPTEIGLDVFADRLAIYRVFGNLVTNAIKFTPENGSIQLGAERIDNIVRMSVSDTGQGIEPQARHTLFERYTRLKKHQQVEGTGLGLFITKNIVEAHNGRIEVQSELGAGTTFIICLPDEVITEQTASTETDESSQPALSPQPPAPQPSALAKRELEAVEQALRAMQDLSADLQK